MPVTVLGSLVAAGIVTGLPAAATTGDAARPQISILITTEADEVEPEVEVGYDVTVANHGDSDTNIAVEVTAPSGAMIGDVEDEDATVDRTTVSWPVTVPAGSDASLGMALSVGSVETGMNGYSAKACALVDGNSTPVVCSTEITQITGAYSIRSQPSGDGMPGWLIAVGGVAVAGGAGALALRRRRHNGDSNADRDAATANTSPPASSPNRT